MNRPGSRRRLRAGAASPGGFTLVELMLGLSLLGIFAAALAAVLTGTSRLAIGAMQSLAIERTTGSLQGFLQQELRDATADDISLVTATRIGLARPIGDAMLCAASDSTILVADTIWNGTRAPEPGRDDAWLLVDPANGSWQKAAITAVAPDRCPADGARAMRLSLAASIPGATVLRVMEPVMLSAYPAGSSDWFGLTAATPGSIVQPFAGPLEQGTTAWNLDSARLASRLQPVGAPARWLVLTLAPGP